MAQYSMTQYMRYTKYILPILVFAIFLSGCSFEKAYHGYFVDGERLGKVQPGKTTTEGVYRILGSPSQKSALRLDGEGEKWFYISSMLNYKDYLKPELEEQKVYEIKFDSRGIVESVNLYNKDNSFDVKIVERETATEGQTIGFVEQMLGNLGKFNAERSFDPQKHRRY